MFAYCGNNPIEKTDATGYYWDCINDSNENGIDDALDIRWQRLTYKYKAKQYAENENAVKIRTVDKGAKKAVECDVYFEKFNNEFSDPYFADELCKQIENKVRVKEKSIIDNGDVLAGSMTYNHMYGELMGHYSAFFNFPSMYQKAHVATLNYDEDRWYVKAAIWFFGHDRPID